MTQEYQNALSEVDTILNFMSKDMIMKIPDSFLEFIKQKKSKSYIPDFNMNLPLNEQKLLKETRAILSLIYRSYLCNKDIRKRLEIDDIVQLRIQNIRLREKYNADNIFKKKEN